MSPTLARSYGSAKVKTTKSTRRRIYRVLMTFPSGPHEWLSLTQGKRLTIQGLSTIGKK